MPTNVAISSGHNRWAVGAKFGDYSEFTLATRWVDTLMCELGKYPNIKAHRVPPTTLTKKVAFVNEIPNCKLALEIHFNSVANKTVRGCETLYCPKSVIGKTYARGIQENLLNSMVTRDRGIKEGWYKQDRPGVVDYDGDQDGDEKIAYWLLNTRAPSIIIEPEFISQVAKILEKQYIAMSSLAKWISENVR